jgi:hypothetical protein
MNQRPGEVIAISIACIYLSIYWLIVWFSLLLLQTWGNIEMEILVDSPLHFIGQLIFRILPVTAGLSTIIVCSFFNLNTWSWFAMFSLQIIYIAFAFFTMLIGFGLIIIISIFVPVIILILLNKSSVKEAFKS